MPYLTIRVSITSDAGALPQQIFDKIRRVFLTEAQVINLLKAGSDGAGAYSTVPTVAAAPILNAVVLSPLEAQVNFRLNSALGPGIIPIKAGGLLLALDCALDAGASSNATVNNPNTTGGSDGTGRVTIVGTAGGT